LGLTTSCSNGQILQWNTSSSTWACTTVSGTGTITGVTAGTDLTGGGTAGMVTLNLDTTKVPQLATANTFIASQTVQGNVIVQGPSPWIDVKSYGAQGNTQTGIDGVMASASSTVTAPPGTFSCTPSCASSPDVGKQFSINNAPEPPPTLPVPSSGSGSISPTAVIYYRLTLINSGGEGTPSQEGFFSIGGTSTGSIQIPAPTGDSTTGAWNVYAAESDQESGTSILADNTPCSAAGLCRTSGTTVTVTTSSAHGFMPGQTVLITGVSTSCTGMAGQGFEGAFVIATASSTTFTYSQLGTSGQHCGGGTVGIYDSASGYEELQPTSGCSATTTVVLTNKVGGGSITGCSITSGTTWTASSPIARNGTAAPPTSSVSIGTISTVNSTGSIIVSFTAPNYTPEGSAFAWGNDDTGAIQNALNSAPCNPSVPQKFGCKVFFPPGSYWVQNDSASSGPANLNIANTQPFVFLAGAGAASSKALGSGLVGMISATSEIVTPDAIYPLVVGTSGGNAFNAGPKISNLGFRDISVGNAKGGIQFLGVAHAFLDNLSFIDFSNGAGVNFDTTNATMQFSQFNYVLDPTIQNTRTPFLFTGATASSNYIEGGNLIGSQLGGGACIDFQPDGASSKNTGHNYIHYPQCNYFPTGMSLYDQNSDEIVFHAENSFVVPTGQGAPIGSPGAGTGIILDGVASGCVSDQLAQTSFTSFALGVSVSANCAYTSIASPSFSATATHVSDSGVLTQTSAPSQDLQNLAFAGAGNGLVEYLYNGGGTITPSHLECFSATSPPAATNCTATPPVGNFIGVALAQPSSAGGNLVPVQFAGTVTLALDGHTSSPAVGDYVCASSSAASEGRDPGTGMTCNQGQQVGIIAETISASAAVVFLQKY
jgi:hypothetical protein